jgi:twitching motility protein PilJ
MSFVNKIKGWGQKSDAGHDVLEHDAAFASAYAQAGGTATLSRPDMRLSDVEAAAAFDAPSLQAGATATQPPSIISEAVPSETADFTETRMQGPDSGVAPLGVTLPLIGSRSAAEQQRILLVMLGIGLFGMVVLTIMLLASASRGSAQVTAAGQALMQSQRLAKSVSQALTGAAGAFPEVKESAEVLASNVRSLHTGGGTIAAAPAAAQEALEATLPLVDRAERSAGVVLAQQKALTDVGVALREINRQSFDLLEASEAILSLKLQRDPNRSRSRRSVRSSC